MKANVGGVDRLLRAVIGVVLLVVGVAGKAAIGAVAAWAAIIAGIVALMTSVLRFCGLYTLLGVSTCPAKTEEKQEEAEGEKPEPTEPAAQ